ncbi:MAG TPA: hypothetical protein VHZ55_12625 [Bryobacteraceae bacterium]|nr:hypothetical protein [Bryobacteraceae bacterium]
MDSLAEGELKSRFSGNANARTRHEDTGECAGSSAGTGTDGSSGTAAGESADDSGAT